MKYIKLFIISIIVFGLMLFGISLLFPSNTVVSRATNLAGEKTSLYKLMPVLYQTAFEDTSSVKKFDQQLDSLVHLSEGEFVKSNVQINYIDTLKFPTSFSSNIHQGVALHELAGDSTAVQVFYQIHVPWYQPWNKFGLMLNEAKYGPFLDSAIARIEKMR